MGTQPVPHHELPVPGLYWRRLIEPQLSTYFGKATQRPYLPAGIGVNGSLATASDVVTDS